MRWIIHLGSVGVFLVSFLDGFVIPLPIPGSTDFLLLLLIVRHGNPFALTAFTLAGSILGGWLAWRMAKASGEKLLRRYVPKRIFSQVEKWIKQRGFLAIMIAAMLPPPVPLTPFTLASGALGMKRNRFLLAYALGRGIRYSFVAWLGVHYGRAIIRAWRAYLADYAGEIGWGIAAISIAGIAFGTYKFIRVRREMNAAPAAQPA